ncbi:sterol desaturase [Idiomarina tyrosinivorans]|uniref:Sterol desaturase n=1 Tax=Idiomarina tyrosinivorans TaxID=1445662 RepID=A0A432ZQW3_9GAMM|nr:sterol desaturase family protein [Idiomarina tyrosinivorans]RUO80221.1 sterol desaturase [Idiomarina tyrosinivorans]
MSDSLWRFSIFVGITALMLILQWLAPKRQPRISTRKRWQANIGILLVDIVALRLVAPAGLAAVALAADEWQWGLFNNVTLPAWSVWLLGLIALDIGLYWQHRLFHRIPLLWRMHRVHHADKDFDVSTGVRFHPLEIVLSLGWKAVMVLALGVPASVILVFEILLNACSMFNHANYALPARLEALVRKLLITQELHRIHHSSKITETNSNYGFSVSWWDHLFASFTATAEKGSDGVDIGLTNINREQDHASLWGLLTMPFRQFPQGSVASPQAGERSQPTQSSKG